MNTTLIIYIFNENSFIYSSFICLRIILQQLIQWGNQMQMEIHYKKKFLIQLF